MVQRVIQSIPHRQPIERHRGNPCIGIIGQKDRRSFNRSFMPRSLRRGLHKPKEKVLKELSVIELRPQGQNDGLSAIFLRFDGHGEDTDSQDAAYQPCESYGVLIV